MRLDQKVALVTGGASGIGRDISLQLAALGAVVIINYNKSVDAAQALIDELATQGHQAFAYQANVANYAEVETLIQTIVSHHGRLDILVNNAGITKDGLLLRMSESDFDSVIETNLKGTFNCIKHVTKIMSKQRSGKIINITSVVGVMGNAGQANYAASKAGVIGLTKSVAKELAKRNVCVNAIAPGFIESKMTDILPEDVKAQYQSHIPLERFGKGEEVAHLVAFLASSLSDYITGQVIHVDGGMVM